MKVYVAIILTLVLALAAVGCSSTPAATTAPTQAPVATTAAPVPTVAPTAAPTATPTAEATQGAKNYQQMGSDLMAAESFGGVSMGNTETQVTAALGKPESKSVPQVWGADGLDHSYWSYDKKGIEIGFAKDDAKDKEASVCYIILNAPCTYATQKGIKIGDTADAVKTAYADSIDPQAQTDEGSILVGSPFGGIVLTIEDGKVTSIYVGASAE